MQSLQMFWHLAHSIIYRVSPEFISTSVTADITFPIPRHLRYREVQWQHEGVAEKAI